MQTGDYWEPLSGVTGNPPLGAHWVPHLRGDTRAYLAKAIITTKTAIETATEKAITTAIAIAIAKATKNQAIGS